MLRLLALLNGAYKFLILDFPGSLNRGLRYYYVTIIQQHFILFLAWS